MKKPIVITRPIREGDHAFIFATWLRHMWFSRDNKTTLAKDTFMRLHHGRIEKLLSGPAVLVACLEEDPDVIVGYRVGDFTYLKKAWRGVGIDQLLKETPNAETEDEHSEAADR